MITMNLPEHIERILKYASLAPSSHNSQPWNVYVRSDSELLIQADTSRRLPEVDPTNREAFLSIGAFWENLEQAAGALGFETRSNIFAADTTDTDILEVKLEKRPQTGEPTGVSPVLDTMERRATNREKYEQTPLSSSHLDQCHALLPDRLTYFPRESEKGQWISNNLPEAMSQQAFHDGKQKELADWMRFSRTQAAKRGDGLTPEMLGLPGIVRFIWYTFMNPKSAMSRTFRKGTVKSIKERVTHCAGFFVITGDDGSVKSLLQTGRNFQRLALKCTELKIETHPVSQLIQAPPWNQRSETELELSKPPQWMLCVGYAKTHPKPAVRRPVKEFVSQ